MTTDLDDMPADFAALADWLASLAKGRREEQSPSFGDRLIDFDLGDLAVRIVRDRSQWMLLIGGGAVGGHWFDIGVWAAYLKSSAVARPMPDVAEQAALVRTQLEQMQVAVRRDASLLASLSKLGWDRNRTLLGLPPAPLPPPTDDR